MKSDFFIRKHKVTVALALVIIVAGIYSLFVLPIEQYPQEASSDVIVSAFYPGADAETVADTVAAPLEEQINGVENMISISSQSTDQGTCNITIAFKPGTNPEINTLNVNNRVQTALTTLPEDVIEQGVTVMQGASDLLLIVSVHSKSGNLDNLFLNNFAMLNLLCPIERCSGVGQAAVLGGQQYAMRIWLNPNKMTNLKVSVEEVVNVVNAQNNPVAIGQIGASPAKEGSKFQYTLLTQGRLSTPEQFENIIIRSTSTGAYIRLKDIARVELGGLSYVMHGEMNNKPAAILGVYKLNGANTLKTLRCVKDKINEISKSFPADIEVNMVYDASKSVEASIYEVEKIFILIMIASIIVLFLLLQNIRTLLISVSAIFISVVGTFGAILLFGYSINIITLFGIILAIGIVADDSIIIIENVRRIMKIEDLTSKEAAIKSVKQLRGSIISTTIILFVFFTFIAFILPVAGQLYRPFAVSVIACVILSAFCALILIPFLLCKLLPAGNNSKNSNIILVPIRKITFTVIFCIVVLGIIFFLYYKIPAGFIPDEAQETLIINVQLADGVSMDRTGVVMKNVTNILKDNEDVYAVQSIVGFSVLNSVSSSNFGSAIVILKDSSKRVTSNLGLNQIIDELNKKLAKITDAEIMIVNPLSASGLGGSGKFEYMLQEKESDNSKILASVLDNLLIAANESPVLSQVSSTYKNNIPKIFLEVDRDKIEKMGISMNKFTNTIQAYLGTLYLNEFNLFGQVYQVLMQAEPQFRDSIQDVYNLYVLNKLNQPVQFKTFVKAKTVMKPGVVSHYNMLNSATVSGGVALGYSIDKAIIEMERISKEVLPDSFTYSWSSDDSYRGIIVNNKFILAVALTIVFVYLVLLVHYNSWSLALCVIFSVPVAISGYVVTLWSAELLNNIFTQIGLILLFALTVKFAILIVDFAEQKRKEGRTIFEAVLAAVKFRFNAIVISVLIFVFGILSLVFASEVSLEYRMFFGLVILGGILISSLLGVVFVPLFYVVIKKLIERKSLKRN